MNHHTFCRSHGFWIPGFVPIVLLLCCFVGAGHLHATPPPQYDLRSIQIGPLTESWVPDIQDQGIFNDCWTFASATSMESNLLMNGYLPTHSTPPHIKVSSWHLSTANGAPESLVGPAYGGSGTGDWGGFEYQALGYATRGSGMWSIPGISPSSTTQITTLGGGPVLNSSDPLNPFPDILRSQSPANIGYLLPPAQQNQAFVARSIFMLDQGFGNNVPLPNPITPGGVTYDFNQGASDNQVIAVKNVILARGAVTTSMNANYNYFSYVPNGNGTYTVQYFNPGKDPFNIDHEVTIIGWDDTYQMTDPNTNHTSTGAWIVQNSWGRDYWTTSDPYPNDGTFYVSYNDASIGRVGVASFGMEPMGQYSQHVLQNELGPMAYSYYYDAGQNPLGMVAIQETRAASVLTADFDSTLLAVGLSSFLGGIDITLRIYESWADGPANLLSTESFFMSGIGYELFDLSTSIDLTGGQRIVMEVTYSAAGAIPVVIGGSGLYNGFDAAPGLSYAWNGTEWVDLHSLEFAANTSGFDTIQGGVFFLKGVLAIPEPSSAFLFAGAVLVLYVTRRRFKEKSRSSTVLP